MAPIDDPHLFAEKAAMTLEVCRAHAGHPWIARGPWWRCARWECIHDYNRAVDADGWGPVLLAVIDKGETC